LYACVYRPPDGRATLSGSPQSDGEPERLALRTIAEQFSPRYECHGDDLVSIDVRGLERLLGPAQAIGAELRREAAARGIRAHTAVAGTRMAAALLAIARPGLTVVPRGAEAEALAPIAVGILEKIDDADRTPSSQKDRDPKHAVVSAVSAFERWGLKTLGELAALPPADLAARLGKPALAFQAMARGEDIRPLVPTLADERFDGSLDLDWPIEELEPLSFVLTRLLEPLSTRLERRDRGAAVLHVLLRLVSSGRGEPLESRETYARRLELPSPLRDVRTLRTLALLDLEAHPPGAGIDRVTIVIDPTPGRVLQHTLFTRAHPTPEQLSTLVARLGALMGQDRFGAPATVDSYRPGAFMLTAFATLREPQGRPEPRRGATDHDDHRRARGTRRENLVNNSAGSALNVVTAVDSESRTPTLPPGESRVVSALRRCRQPVPARVAVAGGRPVRVTTDRRGFAGGTVVGCAGPWRASGEWWMGEKLEVRSEKVEVQVRSSDFKVHTSGAGGAGPWNRDEWDVSLSDGAVYRIFRDRDHDRWFIDAIVD
jgi:protein ImuB